MDIRLDDEEEHYSRKIMEDQFRYALQWEERGDAWQANACLDIAIIYEEQLKRHQEERMRILHGGT